ncbi:A/G-specific adenine glycosylase [Brumimicrobium salinarum]|uniref:A/G-specific adenine glycosylase n=1 Tax=Brumimicrobium salinarum TaxID=2058658 RepID=UPI001F0BA556|nr:A/G-specific adenine glycosylase [Brumimicrobium salinarum]
MHHFSLSIQVWYRQNGRILPWRATKNPYKIWLSEIILQQTRVEQGKAYYIKILKRFPKVEMLAAADEQEVLKLWQGLGYYSRARNLHAAAKQVVNDFEGVFPCTFKDILSLKGVGDYTASAIASFAFDLPHAVLDGNVFRLLSRYFNDPTPIDTTIGKKTFKQYVDELLDVNDPATFNQAIMEMGALVCKPKNPDCENCVLNSSCLAYNEGNPLTLPVKAKKVKVTKKYFHYFIYPSEYLQLIKRDDQGIWKNMYEFPVIETTGAMGKNEINKQLQKNMKLMRLINCLRKSIF